MANIVFVQTGQCGNQLGYALLDNLYSQLCAGEPTEDESNLETLFRVPLSTGQRPVARAVCLDTEPKVVNESFHKASRGKWRLDPKSAAYRHGGAGNNWALGYEMASGEFLETSTNLIRRELELCDYSQTLVFMHSVAGGTGSGLGTKISEACADDFRSASRLNIAIAPYHFGEVVVQHYNAILCLSKISAASEAVMVFENEVAQMLCKTMKGIERPSLDQLNSTIVANICPMFLPRQRAEQALSPFHGLEGRHSLRHDITHLCAHPGYKFLDIKSTPQTSNQSVEFTYDSWNTLVKTIQQMQLSGSASERNIKSYLKHALQSDVEVADRARGLSIIGNGVAGGHQYSSPAGENVSRSMRHTHSIGGGSTPTPTKTTPGHHSPTAAGQVHRTPPFSGSKASPSTAATSPEVVRSVASVVTLHGEEAHTQASILQHSYDQQCGYAQSDVAGAGAGAGSGGHRSPVAKPSPTYAKAGKTSALQVLQQQQQHAELQLHNLYLQSHAPLMAACGQPPVQICASSVPLNGYQRATSVLANSQAVLPLLQRAVRGGAELFEAGAYLHQYSMYGIEEDDFQRAFLNVGCSIQNYLNL